ncbi:MAG: hypothetical protein RLZZ387_5544 [Chloroflexota bacterium]
MRRLLIIGLLALAAAHATPAAAQGRSRCFAETGHCITGPILAYWERNGGLPVFGYPTGPLAVDTVYEQDSGATWTGPAQWFERDRLEDHTAEGKGVLAGRLGAQVLYYEARPWTTFPQVVAAAPGCRYFAETRHSLCEPFLSYWQRGGGLERFGYPITEAFQATVEAWSGTVQYFERRRMEHHTERPGAPVLLGLLGNEVRGLAGATPCVTEVIPELRETWKPDQVAFAFQRQMGCPTEAIRSAGVARQQYERGVLLYAAVGQGEIYALKTDPQPLRYTRHIDTWGAGQPFSGGETPPAGRIEPVRGFGKVWREQPGVREALGWATDYEVGDTGTLQRFERGAILWTAGDDFVWIFGPEGQATAFPRR